MLTSMRYQHVALFVGSDLEAAETYYTHLFDMRVLLREGPHPDGSGQWAQLPHDRTWEDVRRDDLFIAMVALERDSMILPLFAGEPTGDRVFAIGVVTSAEDIATVASRLTTESVEESSEQSLSFIDRYGARWQLSASERFVGQGDLRGIWLTGD
jgi:catechol 2,3-dioxygenase-like lactoylglutathione lyase family enzyme